MRGRDAEIRRLAPEVMRVRRCSRADAVLMLAALGPERRKRLLRSMAVSRLVRARAAFSAARL